MASQHFNREMRSIAIKPTAEVNRPCETAGKSAHLDTLRVRLDIYVKAEKWSLAADLAKIPR